MTESETMELINTASSSLGIVGILDAAYREELSRESDGHPYVVKILLGEVARAGRTIKLERAILDREDILTALFERSYGNLTPAAKRVFMTLSKWRSVVPVLGLQAVLMRPGNERINVDKVINELERSSLIEVISSEEDHHLFLSIPLAAASFGKRKLQVNPAKAAVEADLALLQAFGAAKETDVRHGIQPRVERLFKFVAQATEPDTVTTYIPVLKYVANKYPRAWLLLAELYIESGEKDADEKAKNAVLLYLEEALSREDLDRTSAWQKLGDIARRMGDGQMEVHAMVEMAQDHDLPYFEVSEAANRVNARFRERLPELQSEEKRILVEKLVDVMEERVVEASATDLSRLAWLCLNLHDEDRAREYTIKGLVKDGGNDYCHKLAKRLGINY